MKSEDISIILEKIPKDVLLELSFFNFRNAVTACAFTDVDLNIKIVNKNFRKLLPKNVFPEAHSLRNIFKKLFIKDEAISQFEKAIQTNGKCLLPYIEAEINSQKRYFSLYATYTGFEDVGSFHGLQLQLIDRTEEKLLKLREEKLISQLHHDMNNRIMSTTMHSELIKMMMNKLDANIKTEEIFHQITSSINDIRESSLFLSELALQMVDIHKLHSGLLKLKFTDFSITKTVRQIIDSHKFSINKNNKSIDFEGPEISIHADKTQIIRIIENLITNAAKYAKEKITCKIESLDKDFLLTVADDGDGIESQFLEKIFDPFFQIPGNEKKNSNGLGLDSVKELAILHKGDVWAESDGLKKGSQFILKLPKGITEIKDSR